MPKHTEKKSLIILILGAMTALSPFSIDMYLPAFPQIANDFGTTVPQVSLSLSAYFIGLSFGQLVYGPLLDRFGRKRPLYIGLLIYILASLGCLFSHSTETLIAWRFVQAIGGCAAGVASMAMVRDLFETHESAKVFSLLILILGTSPLLAPTIGGYLSGAFGWHSVFITLAAMSALLLLVVKFYLPESHQPDHSVALRIKPIARDFWIIGRNPEFYIYVLSGSIAFSGLFVYLAGSPVIFMESFKATGQEYGWIFAIIATGMILSSQVNVTLLNRFTNRQILQGGLMGQFLIGVIFMIGIKLEILGLKGSVAMFFLYMACFGVTNPNANALALAPFASNAGRASALMGFLQMGIGALASTLVGALSINGLFPVVGIMTSTSFLGVAILRFGRKRGAAPA
jgi:DHA1 family bicyclomycin/chloramphenicol resistance-like MFS transporter